MGGKRRNKARRRSPTAAKTKPFRVTVPHADSAIGRIDAAQEDTVSVLLTKTEGTMSDQTERRRCARLNLDTKVEFRRMREAHYQIPMRDLTPHGCRIAAPERVDAGEMVWVQLPSLESLSARVRWSNDWQSGVEFNRPLHPAVFDMMAGRLAPASGEAT